jgi:hypothetical protein
MCAANHEIVYVQLLLGGANPKRNKKSNTRLPLLVKKLLIDTG